MFTIEDIEPNYYRKQTRKATIKIMALFIVIGFSTARLTIHLLGEYSNNHLVLNFIGAFLGLLITAAIVKIYFADKKWMKEAIYAWKLKRHLMAISNVLNNINTAIESNDIEAMKALRFYHLGTAQMHLLEDNNHALIDLKPEMNTLELKMNELGVELEQIKFDLSKIEKYKRK